MEISSLPESGWLLFAQRNWWTLERRRLSGGRT